MYLINRTHHGFVWWDPITHKLSLPLSGFQGSLNNKNLISRAFRACFLLPTLAALVPWQDIENYQVAKSG